MQTPSVPEKFDEPQSTWYCIQTVHAIVGLCTTLVPTTELINFLRYLSDSTLD
jgi:hypothetical protein